MSEASPLAGSHQRFVEEYTGGSSASAAASAAGLAVVSDGVPGGFYVYGLVHPAVDRVFYVGKGCGKRWMAHYVEQAAALGNHGKRARIRDAGQVRRCIVFAEGLEEDEAFRIERALIDSLPDLENLAPGQRTEDERQIEAAKEVLAEMGTIEKFKASGSRSAGAVAYYGALLDELQAIIDGKRPTRAVWRIRTLPDGTVERTRKLGDGPWEEVA